MAAVKQKRDQRTKQEVGLCVYCMKNMAHQMVTIKHGPNAKYRRWMCSPCLARRQELGVVKPGANPNEFKRAN